jgi:hypothetical protein
MILRFESLEGRELLATTAIALPDLVATQFDTAPSLDWGQAFKARGEILNQGDAPSNALFHVNIYASSTPLIGDQAVFLGQATVPVGLRPGEKTPFEQTVNLPATPPAGFSGTGPVYIGLVIDPEGAVVERNESNNLGNGQGLDIDAVTIAPMVSPVIVGVSLGVYPDQLQWGQTVRVNTQIRNESAGEAPPTRARVVLTPAGVVPGSGSDVTIGSLQVPAIAPWQTLLVSQSIDLPSVPPRLLAGNDKFLLSVVQDADHVADLFTPHVALKGPGIDMAPVVISSPPGATLNPNAPLPDLIATSVLAPSLPLTFGGTFQVTASIQNRGRLDSGPFRVRFLLVGPEGSPQAGLFLADTTLDGLKAGFGQEVVQTLRLPSRLPPEATIQDNTKARIAILIDPESVFDEADKANNVSVSDVVTLQLIGKDGQVSVPSPTAPPVQPVSAPALSPPPRRGPMITARPLPTGGGAGRPTGTAPSGPPRTAPRPSGPGNRRVFGPRAPRPQPIPALRLYPGLQDSPNSGRAGQRS